MAVHWPSRIQLEILRRYRDVEGVMRTLGSRVRRLLEWETVLSTELGSCDVRCASERVGIRSIYLVPVVEKARKKVDSKKARGASSQEFVGSMSLL